VIIKKNKKGRAKATLPFGNKQIIGYHPFNNRQYLRNYCRYYI